MKSKTQILREASEIAGSLWDDRQRDGTLAEQLAVVASGAAHGTDGDLTEQDRDTLRALSQDAQTQGL